MPLATWWRTDRNDCRFLSSACLPIVLLFGAYELFRLLYFGADYGLERMFVSAT